MKKIICLSLLLLCAAFFSCTLGEIETIIYDSGAGTITITLDENNYVDKSTVISKIRLTKGSFTSEPIIFNIPGFPTPGTSYTLDSFNPPLERKKTYYFIFEKGTFGNYGQWYNSIDIKWESDPGIYKLYTN